MHRFYTRDANLALRTFVALCDTHRHARSLIVLRFVIVAEGPSPLVLGLPAAERNRRVAGRHGGIASPDVTGFLPTLTVPPQAAITSALFPLLFNLRLDRIWHLTWHPTHPPLVWTPVAGLTERGVMAVGANVVLDVSSRTARRTAAWQLLRATGKPQDGWLSRHVHRKISRPLSYMFLWLGLSANVATLFAFGIGLLAAFMMAQTSHATMIAGGFLFWFASVADGIDGEIARATLSESRFGEQLDTGVDQLTHLAGLVGVLVGWTRQGITSQGVALATFVVAGTPALLLWAMALVRHARATHQFFVPTKPIETAIVKAADDTGALALRTTATVFVLFRREAFSLAFFLISLVTARRAAIPTAVAAGLIVVAVTFIVHGRTLMSALREIVGPQPAGVPRAPAARGSSAPA